MSAPKDPPPFNFQEAVQELIQIKESLPGQSHDELIKVAARAAENVAVLAEYQIQCMQRSVLTILRAGYVLLVLKEKTDHGNWGSFIEKNFKISKATICRYMKAAKAYPDPSVIAADMTIAELYGAPTARENSKEGMKNNAGGKAPTTTLLQLPARLAAIEKDVHLIVVAPNLDSIPDDQRHALRTQMESVIAELQKACMHLAPASKNSGSVSLASSTSPPDMFCPLPPYVQSVPPPYPPGYKPAAPPPPLK